MQPLSLLYVMPGVILILNSVIVAQEAGPDQAHAPVILEMSKSAMPPGMLNEIGLRNAKEYEAKSLAALKVQFQQDLGVSDEEMAAIWPRHDVIVDELYFAVSGKKLLTESSQPQPWASQTADYAREVADLSHALAELDQVAKDPATSPEQITSKLEVARQLQARNWTNLQAARNELRKILTARQEAMCIVWGLLDAPAADAAGASPTTLPAMSDAEMAVYQRRQTSQLKTAQRGSGNILKDLGLSGADASTLRPMIEKCDGARRKVHDSTLTNNFGVGRRFLKTATLNRPDLPVTTPLPALIPAGLAIQDLDRLLHNKDATITAIQAQVQSVRQLQQQANDDYLAAMTELRSIVTVRQEAMLYLHDVLD